MAEAALAPAVSLNSAGEEQARLTLTPSMEEETSGKPSFQETWKSDEDETGRQ